MRVIGITADITERKRHEQALRDSEERYRVLFQQSHDAMTIVAARDWRFIDANPAALEMFGAATFDDLVSLNPADTSPLYQPDGRLSSEKAVEMNEIALLQGSHFFEWTLKRRDGSPLPCTMLLNRVDYGGRTFVQGTARDISALKKTEAALRESEQNYRLILDHSSDVIWTISPEGVLTYASPSWKRLTGYDPASVLGALLRRSHPSRRCRRLRRGDHGDRARPRAPPRSPNSASATPPKLALVHRHRHAGLSARRVR